MISFENSYATLPERFYATQPPAPVAAPELLRFNAALADALGTLDIPALRAPEGVAVLAGNAVAPGSAPLAMAYAGHQFGHFVPSLGDGRALLLGEFLTADGRRCDLQLKGSGRTPFSRGGDGRAALGPVIREYVVSEGMAGLGVPTTRALAMVRTGEKVLRQWGAEPGGVLARVAASHIRVGTFEYFAARRDDEAVRALAEYVIARHYPALRDHENPPLALLEAVCRRTAALVARWQHVGFIHGVMNTDNMSVAGETLDYGPCAFLDTYHPQKAFSSIDHHGRYAYGNQPMIGAWNMGRLADTLLPLIADEESVAVQRAQAAIEEHYLGTLSTHLVAGWRAKLGLAEARAEDEQLVQDLLAVMAEEKADFTRTFRALCALSSAAPDDADDVVRGEFRDARGFDEWAVRWRERQRAETRPAPARQQAMRSVNPAFIPRNHQVEKVIAAFYEGDASADALLDDLLTVCTRPYDEHPTLMHLAQAPTRDEVVERTFCGT